MTLSGYFASKSVFDQQGCRALTFALARLSCSVNYSVYCICSLWLVPRVTNRPQSVCFTDFAPSNDKDQISTLVSRINDHIDSGLLKG